MLLFEALKPTWKFNPKLYPKQRGATSTIICQLADPVQDKIHNLFSDGVVSACEVIGSIFLSRNQLFRMEQLAVRTSANFINHLVSRTHRVEKSVVQCKHGKHGHAMCSRSKTDSNRSQEKQKQTENMFCSNTSGWQLAPSQPSRILARVCLPLSQRRTFHVDIKKIKLWVANSNKNNHPLFIYINILLRINMVQRHLQHQGLEPDSPTDTKSACAQQFWSFHGSGARIVDLEAFRLAQHQQSYRVAAQHEQRAHNKQESLIPTTVVWGAFNNGGDKYTTGNGSSNSRSRDNRCTCSSAQAEAETTNIRWQPLNIWRVEVQIHSRHGNTRPNISTAHGKSRDSNSSTRRSWSQNSSRNNTRSRVLDTTINKPQVHPDEHHIRISINSSTTTSARDRTWGIQATMCQVLNTIGNKEHWIPSQTPKANICSQQLRRALQQLGIWTTTLWGSKHNTTSRPSEDSSVDEWNKKDHYNNPYISMQEHHQHMRKSEQQSWSTTGLPWHSQGYNNPHQLSAATLAAVQHQWT